MISGFAFSSGFGIRGRRTAVVVVVAAGRGLFFSEELIEVEVEVEEEEEDKVAAAPLESVVAVTKGDLNFFIAGRRALVEFVVV